MKYVLITPSGKQFVYHVKGCAEMFQNIFGGTIHVFENGTIKDN